MILRVGFLTIILMKKRRIKAIHPVPPITKIPMEQFLQEVKEVEPIHIPGYVCIF